MAYPKVDYHIHSFFSPCAARSMTVKKIVRGAEKAGFEAIAITDHIDEPEDLQRCREVSEQLERLRPSIKVLVGCEVEATRPEPPVGVEDVSELDIVLISTTHRHSMPLETIPKDTPESAGQAFANAIERAAGFQWGHVIVHPLAFFEGKSYIGEALEYVGEERLRDIMITAARNSIAFEISPRVLVSGPTEPIANFYRMCSECGAKVSLGSDAHQLNDITNVGFLFSIMRQAGLSEEDVLII